MSSLWDRYQKYLLRHEKPGFSIDISRMRFGDDFLPKMKAHASATAQTTEQIAAGLGEDPEAVFHALSHLAANDSRVRKQSGGAPGSDAFQLA